MTKVYMWGDSWAKGYSEQLLINAGYDVTNLATNGAGNFHSIFLSGSYDAPDYVIWYHTEMLRDLELMTNRLNLFGCPYNYDQAIHDIANKIYELASGQLEKWKHVKLIVLEGQSPIIAPEFGQWLTPYKLKNWRRELYSESGKLLKVCPYLSTHRRISSSQCVDTDDVKNNLLKLVDNHYDEMITNNLFPDNGHPSDSAHEQLIDWFVKIDQGTL